MIGPGRARSVVVYLVRMVVGRLGSHHLLVRVGFGDHCAGWSVCVKAEERKKSKALGTLSPERTLGRTVSHSTGTSKFKCGTSTGR